jgi:hypothetical protein
LVLPSFVVHICFAAYQAYRNPIKQVKVIQFQYFAAVLESLVLAYLAIAYVRGKKKNGKQMHMVRMFFMFAQTVFGSGAIRLTAWLLWMIGKFFG